MTKKKPKKKLKFVTLIWEQLPEAVTFFIIPRSKITKDDLKMLKACHGNFVNSVSVNVDLADKETVNASLIRLLNMLEDPSADWLDDKYRDDQADGCNMTREDFDAIVGKWHSYKLDATEPRTIPRSKLYRSGFLM